MHDRGQFDINHVRANSAATFVRHERYTTLLLFIGGPVDRVVGRPVRCGHFLNSCIGGCMCMLHIERLPRLQSFYVV